MILQFLQSYLYTICAWSKKYNEQYPAIEVKEFRNFHDRFVIIDNTSIYHVGASLEDLGEKWFAFSKMDIGAVEMLENLKKEKLL